MDYLINIDSDLLLWINGAHNAFFDAFMMLFTNKFIWVPMYLALAYLLFRNMSLKQEVMCLVAIALLVVITDQMSSSLIRYAVGRLRPANLENPISDMVHIVDGYRGGRYGFPSSHAANSFGVAIIAGLIMKHRTVLWSMLGWAVLQSFSRIYLGVHYPGDALGGAVLGVVAALLVYGILELMQRFWPNAFSIEKFTVSNGRLMAYSVALTIIIIAAISPFWLLKL